MVMSTMTFAHYIIWLLGRGGSLSLSPAWQDDQSHMHYQLDGVDYTGHGASIEDALINLYNFVRASDREAERGG